MRTRLINAIAAGAFACMPQAFAAEPWHQQVATGLGKQGSEMPGGVYRVSLPRTDLKVTLDGVDIKPALALGSWLAFKPRATRSWSWATLSSPMAKSTR